MHGCRGLRRSRNHVPQSTVRRGTWVRRRVIPPLLRFQSPRSAATASSPSPTEGRVGVAKACPSTFFCFFFPSPRRAATEAAGSSARQSPRCAGSKRKMETGCGDTTGSGDPGTQYSTPVDWREGGFLGRRPVRDQKNPPAVLGACYVGQPGVSLGPGTREEVRRRRVAQTKKN